MATLGLPELAPRPRARLVLTCPQTLAARTSGRISVGSALLLRPARFLPSRESQTEAIRSGTVK